MENVTDELTKKLDDFFDEKYATPEVCSIFYKTVRGFVNINEESHIGIGIYPSSNNRIAIHFLKFNAKNDKIKIASRRVLFMCPMTKCLLKNAIDLAKLKEGDKESEENNYIQ